MFETRVNKIAEFDGLNKRKLWEGWLQWANRLSRIDSDNIKRRQFTRENFKLNSFMDMYSINHPTGGGAVIGRGSTLIAGSEKFITLETSGEYWITWSLTLQSKTPSGCRTAFAMPFIGDSLIGAAQDCYCEMGWYNNQELAEVVERPATSVGRFGLIDEDEVDSLRYATEMPWDEAFGKQGMFVQSQSFISRKNLIPPQLKINDYVHLSGSGGAYVSRSTGSIGIIVNGFKGSRFKIVSSSISIHKRSR